MIPARTTCYEGWTRQYYSYLMAEYFNHVGRTEYICVDHDPEGVAGSAADQNGVLMYFTEACCGALPCPNYVEGNEVTCVVCTK